MTAGAKKVGNHHTHQDQPHGHLPRPYPAWVTEARSRATAAERKLWQALEEVQDPEYPVSVVDMGLIYGLQQQGGKAQVQLTFTSMGCPCMEFIIDDIRERLLQEPGVNEVDLEIVWDPPWTRNRLSARAVNRLKSWGIRV